MNSILPTVLVKRSVRRLASLHCFRTVTPQACSDPCIGMLNPAAPVLSNIPLQALAPTHIYIEGELPKTSQHNSNTRIPRRRLLQLNSPPHPKRKERPWTEVCSNVQRSCLESNPDSATRSPRAGISGPNRCRPTLGSCRLRRPATSEGPPVGTSASAESLS